MRAGTLPTTAKPQGNHTVSVPHPVVQRPQYGMSATTRAAARLMPLKNCNHLRNNDSDIANEHGSPIEMKASTGNRMYWDPAYWPYVTAHDPHNDAPPNHHMTQRYGNRLFDESGTPYSHGSQAPMRRRPNRWRPPRTVAQSGAATCAFA